MSYTLADAIRDQFKRDHPHGKNALFCDQCRNTKDREDFRETPWHGRAAACKGCEGMNWLALRYEEQLWKLEQERAKSRGLRYGLSLVRRRDIYRHFRQRYVLTMEER